MNMQGNQQGDGIMKNLKSLSKVRTSKQLMNHMIQVQTDDYNMIKGVIFNRSGLGPRELEILDKHGNEKITAIRIYRMPLSNVLTSLFNVVTFGQFSERQKTTEYDKLFHLRMDIKLSSGKMVSFEKTDQVNIKMNQSVEKGSETLEAHTIPDITFAELVENTRKYMGNDGFLRYSAKNNNCQDFLMGIIKANQFNTPELETFTKQDTKVLFDGYLRKLSHTATDLAGRATVLMEGGCLQCSCGCTVKHGSYAKHLKTKKHLKK